jgi:uncharacterized protein YbcV (DUF1398 family)
MNLIKKSQTLHNIKQNVENSQTDFGNGWGFYIDIENFKSTLPKNYDIIRKKLNTQTFYDETIDEVVDEYEYYINLKDIKIDINATKTTPSVKLYNSNSNSNKNKDNDKERKNKDKNITFILNLSSNIIIVLIITYVIIFVI